MCRSRWWAVKMMVLTYAAAGCMEHHVLHDVPDPFVIDAPARATPAPAPKAPPKPPPAVREVEPRTITVVVDAGHGGKDPGAQHFGLDEKEVNLHVSMSLARALRARGITVVTTRDSDVFIPLDDRAATADRLSADLLISIHADAAERVEASGTTVFIARGGSATSRAIADRIHSAFVASNIESRGVKTAGFRVLVGHDQPAVLVECGFLTNEYDARRLAKASYRERLARLLADAIADHFGL